MGCRQKKAGRRNYYVVEGDDHLSQLPDEIIINILSRLTFKESGRTCVLSRRWEKLWLSTSHCSGPNKLIFPRSFYRELLYNPEGPLFHRKRALYIGLLNKVLKIYPHPLLDELSINFYLNSTFSSVIHDWIKFAFSKGVKQLELDFSYPLKDEPYAFPSLHNEHFRGYGIHRLRVLCLKHVYVNQRVVDALLSTCPLLESLSLEPRKLGNLTISGETLKLKHLELSLGWFQISRIEISAPHLISLGYEGRVRTLHLKCVPCLSEFYVRDTDVVPFFILIGLHLGSIFQLKKLNWYLRENMFLSSGLPFPSDLPEFLKLEELEVKIWGWNSDAFLWPTVIIKAAPLLRRFAIESEDIPDDTNFFAWRPWEIERRRLKDATKCRHQFLKEMEFSKFQGTSSEIELARHLFDIGAQSLERVVIDTRSRFVEGDINAAEEMRKIALNMGQGLDLRVEFMVL